MTPIYVQLFRALLAAGLFWLSLGAANVGLQLLGILCLCVALAQVVEIFRPGTWYEAAAAIRRKRA